MLQAWQLGHIRLTVYQLDANVCVIDSLLWVLAVGQVCYSAATPTVTLQAAVIELRCVESFESSRWWGQSWSAMVGEGRPIVGEGVAVKITCYSAWYRDMRWSWWDSHMSKYCSLTVGLNTVGLWKINGPVAFSSLASKYSGLIAGCRAPGWVAIISRYHCQSAHLLLHVSMYIGSRKSWTSQI